MLTEELKQNRIIICRQIIVHYDSEKYNVLNVIVTGN